MAEQSGCPRGDNLVVADERNDADQRQINELANLGQRANPWPRARSARNATPDPSPIPTITARIKSGTLIVGSAADTDRGDRLRRHAVVVADQPRLLELVDHGIEKGTLTLKVAPQIRFFEERDLGLLGEAQILVEFLLQIAAHRLNGLEILSHVVDERVAVSPAR